MNNQWIRVTLIGEHTYFQGAHKEKVMRDSYLNGISRKSRGEKTTFVIVDARSVQNTDTAEQRGYDAGKQVSGIKRYIAVDTQELPIR